MGPFVADIAAQKKAHGFLYQFVCALLVRVGRQLLGPSGRNTCQGKRAGFGQGLLGPAPARNMFMTSGCARSTRFLRRLIFLQVVTAGASAPRAVVSALAFMETLLASQGPFGG